jgi:hypothetical protein
LVVSSDVSLERWRASYVARRAAEERKIAESVLHKNRTRIFDGIKVEYCGIDDDFLLFDVFILALDPLYPYRYKIPKKAAKEGFYLSDRRFRVKYFDSEKIKLVTVLEPRQEIHY